MMPKDLKTYYTRSTITTLDIWSWEITHSAFTPKHEPQKTWIFSSVQMKRTALPYFAPSPNTAHL